MTTTKQYDFLNRLQQISSLPAASVSPGAMPISYGYQYNDANQRTRATFADGSFWVYRYDSLGQVISGKKYWSDGTPVAGQQFEYGFDDIGNRTATKAGGDQGGGGLRSASYSVNSLNQYSSRTVPNAFDVLGLADAASTVSINSSSSGVYRRAQYFRKELSVTNTSNPVWQDVTVTTSGGGSIATGYVFVPAAMENYSYDVDGNLTQDGRWTYTWDGENRLTQAESLASGPLAAKRKVVWEYDGQGRRIRQTTSDGSSGSDVVTEDLKFLSDGWRHIAELNASNNALVRSYVWGLDWSGSLDGAGGVGGLLAMNSAANGAHFYAMDGNGNVAALVKASDGTVSANYEYEAFGSVLRATGTMANENRFQFSTKRCDRTTDLELYEFRPRRPDLAWLNRDPIEEDGSLNIYSFTENDSINLSDIDGLKFINQGRTGRDKIWWKGSDGRGGRNNQYAGDFYGVPIHPDIETKDSGCSSICWVKDQTGIVTVMRSYTGATEGFQGVPLPKKHWFNKKVDYHVQYYIDHNAMLAIDKHEEGHIAATESIYNETVKLAEDVIDSHRKQTPLRYGSSGAECKAKLEKDINWLHRLAQFSKRDRIMNGEGGEYDKDPLHTRYRNRGYHSWSRDASSYFSVDVYIEGAL